MKTIEQWLNELPEPYRSQALENAIGQNVVIFTEDELSLCSALAAAFNWSDTP